MTPARDTPQPEPLDDELRHLAEAVALWFDRTAGDVPRMAGRVLGWLLVCDPPEQTMQDLAADLDVSLGSVSSMIRTLDQLGFVERVSRPGERSLRYRIRHDAWTRTVEESAQHAREFEIIADKGLALLEGADAARRERLETMREWSRFYAAEFPGLIEKWRAHYADWKRDRG